MLLSGCVFAAGCTVARQDGDHIVVACGAVAPIAVCENRALELCPGGYDELSRDRGINRTELNIRCRK